MTTAESIEVSLGGKTRKLQTLPRLGGEAFQHPDDREASNTIDAIPLAGQLFKLVQGSYYDQCTRMENLVSNMRIGPEQGGDLYQKFVLASRVLDLPQLPELFLTMDHSPNAFATGFRHPMVVLHHGIISMLDEAELLAIIGHELGHIKCNHMLNNSLASLFASAGAQGVASMFPIIGNAALMGIQIALLHWSRMAEFSADRAALLVVQDPEVVATALAKLAGFHGKFVPELNFQSLLKQIDDYEAYDKDLIQSLIKLESTFQGMQSASHPHSVLRVKRILDWGASDQYQDILQGHYAPADSTSYQQEGHDSHKCVHCGNFMPLTASFCSHCGQRLV